jgi:putative nucleotidyltransferase with HDIG domain
MLAGQVLKVANSPAFRGRDAETSLRNAVFRLGLKNLGEIVFELALHMRVFRSAEYSDLMERLRRHSTASANLCRVLAKRAGQDQENAFLCGLLHDIGTAAILIVLGERRKAEPALEGAVLGEVVRQTHEDVSGMLVRLWKVPGEVAEVVANHHGRAAIEAAPLLSSMVAVADSLAAKFGFQVDFGAGPCDGSDQDTTSAACGRLGLDAAAMADLEREARQVLDRVDDILKHSPGDSEEHSNSREHRSPTASVAAQAPAAAARVPVSARRTPAGLLARLWQAIRRR